MGDKRKMNKEDMMNRISFALQDHFLQMGFEVIRSELSRLEKEIAELKEEQYIRFPGFPGISITRKELVMAIKAIFDLENDKEELEKEADTPCTKCTDKGKCPGENKEAVYKICKKINEAGND